MRENFRLMISGVRRNFKKHLLVIAGILTGGMAGFLYWKFVGCESGACAITSSPFNSSLYGMAAGALLFSSFKTTEK